MAKRKYKRRHKVEDEEKEVLGNALPTDQEVNQEVEDSVDVDQMPEEETAPLENVSREPEFDEDRPLRLSEGPLPELPANQKYFESPDGRIYPGPEDSHSIPDPENPGMEINPMRLASSAKRG